MELEHWIGANDMRYLRGDLRQEYNQYTSLYPDLPDFRPPLINVSDVLRAYFILIDYFSDPTAENAELMLVGIRDMNLLCSALGRQNTSYAGISKYSAPLDICATLFFGLTKNHAFTDGNKRTALLTLLYQLDRYGLYLRVPQWKFEDLVLAVAGNNLEKWYPSEWKATASNTDPDVADHCVRTISLLLRKMTKKKDNSFHISITAREFSRTLNQIEGCTCFAENGKIHMRRDIERGLWGFRRSTETKTYSIPYRGDTRTINAGTMRNALTHLGLYEQYPNYSGFMDGIDPRYMLIQQFEGPLRRLKDE